MHRGHRPRRSLDLDRAVFARPIALRSEQQEEPRWPEALTRLAKRALAFFEEEIKAQGYHARAQIMAFPGGVPGDAGVFPQVVSR
jgi:hypothetical protein